MRFNLMRASSTINLSNKIPHQNFPLHSTVLGLAQLQLRENLLPTMLNYHSISMFISKYANTCFPKLCNHSYQINSNVCLSHLHGHIMHDRNFYRKYIYLDGQNLRLLNMQKDHNFNCLLLRLQTKYITPTSRPKLKRKSKFPDSNDPSKVQIANLTIHKITVTGFEKTRLLCIIINIQKQ